MANITANMKNAGMIIRCWFSTGTCESCHQLAVNLQLIRKAEFARALPRHFHLMLRAANANDGAVGTNGLYFTTGAKNAFAIQIHVN